MIFEREFRIRTIAQSRRDMRHSGSHSCLQLVRRSILPARYLAWWYSWPSWRRLGSLLCAFLFASVPEKPADEANSRRSLLSACVLVCLVPMRAFSRPKIIFLQLLQASLALMPLMFDSVPEDWSSLSSRSDAKRGPAYEGPPLSRPCDKATGFSSSEHFVCCNDIQ